MSLGEGDWEVVVAGIRLSNAETWEVVVAGIRLSNAETDVVRPVSEIIAALERFQPSNGNWLALDALLEELFQCGSASLGIKAMLEVFEQFPTEDGAGVFWSIVHGLESLDGYERRLVESVRRAPSEFSLIMVHRHIILSAGPDETSLLRTIVIEV